MAPAPPRPPRLSDDRPLLLASSSPRRREILDNVRVPYVVHAAPADESTREGEGAEAYLERVVRAKLDAACAAFAEHSEMLAAVRHAGAVLVADTSVIFDGMILGKPVSTADAEIMVGALAGKTHEVWTRFAIGAPHATPQIWHAETVVTRVTFRPLSREQVRAYADTGEGLDKAGGYAVQGLASALVCRIEGSYTNVVGLPACEVVVALESLGLLP